MRIMQENPKLSRNAYIGQYNTETATQRAIRQQKSSLTHNESMESIKEGDTSATSAKRPPSYARLLHTNQDSSSGALSVRSLPKL